MLQIIKRILQKIKNDDRKISFVLFKAFWLDKGNMKKHLKYIF